MKKYAIFKYKSKGGCMSKLAEVLYLYKNDPNFLKQWRELGPEIACKNAGIEIDADDLEKINSQISLSDEALDKKISK
jgi:hypothetical protein